MWLTKNKMELLEEKKKFSSYQKAFENGNQQHIARWFFAMFMVLLLFLFLPWTQNIQAPGIITTRSPEQRPQELNSIIAGKVEKWYVREGDIVKQGDTILKISEVKENYLDPDLLKRTEEELRLIEIENSNDE